MSTATGRTAGLVDRLYATFDSPRRQMLLMVAIVVVMAVLPLVMGRYATTIMTNALLYVVLALGLNIVVGYAGLLDLGYAAFFAVGAYSIGILTVQFDWNFWLAIPPALVAACLAGVIIGGPTLRLRSDYLAIVTLGFGEIVRFSARNLEITGRASGLSNIPEPSFFGYVINSYVDFYYVFLLLAVMAVIASHRLYHSRLGRAWLYVRHDEDAAEAMGINRVRVKLAAYVTGSVFGAIGGIFFSVNLGAISGELQFRAVGADSHGGDPGRHGQDPRGNTGRVHHHSRPRASARTRRAAAIAVRGGHAADHAAAAQWHLAGTASLKRRSDGCCSILNKSRCALPATPCSTRSTSGSRPIPWPA